MSETDSTTAPPPTKHAVPIPRGQYSASITPPWFVDRSEYTPKVASFKPLVNGEEAFREVYRAIAAAKKDVCLICWGFQPSMYFIRDGQHLMIGKLLEQKAREGVMVRVLCWAYQVTESDRVNVTGAAIGESNTPARWSWMPYSRPDSSTDAQHAYDEQWYNIYDRKQSTLGELGRRYIISDDFPKDKLYFTSRSYSASDRAEVGEINYLDQGISSSTKFALKWAPSHHQKLVLVDHADPDRAVAFVMGHNMLDGYWDTSDHSSVRQEPNKGRNGGQPLHDYSSRVTGPIVGDLFRNFSSAWQRETKESIPLPAFETYPVRGSDARAVCQILRTQPQHGRTDIMKCYLQATANASQYIHIENQYFRWPPLADKIKASAAKLTQWGRTPEQHGSLYLFVITNSSDTGVGSGTVNTYRMLDSLGRADRIPEVTRDQRLADVTRQLEETEAAMAPLLSRRAALDSQARLLQGTGAAVPGLNERYAPINERLGPLELRKQELEAARARLEPRSITERLTGSDRTPEAIKQSNIPGLKVHVATLVAPDTPAGQEWQEVYIHAKLMLIDDTFMTLGSANINSRSMQVDSELNIAHHRPEITTPLRNQQWAMYTGGRVTGGMVLSDAYKKWTSLMDENASAKKLSRRPIAQLAEFLRTSDKISNND
jgi:phosphatidylserine/phosphatidylglycerophosphate/cardiolipin synthase-like enzyme